MSTQRPADAVAVPAPLMSVGEVARRLAISNKTVYAAIHDGRLEHHRFGNGQGGIRVREAQVAAFLEKTRRRGAAPKFTPAPRQSKYRHFD